MKIKISGTDISYLTPERIGNLYVGQQSIQFGRYKKGGKATIEMTAKISGEKRRWSTTTILPDVASQNPELERLWALAKIDQAMAEIRENGENAALRKQVTALGVDYSLVTDYTSMLVATDDVMETQGIQRRNADRVAVERSAQAQKTNQPASNYRVDQNSNSFSNRPSPGIGYGSGPVGLLLIPLAAWLNRKKKH